MANNISRNRRNNLLLLLRDFTESELSAGRPPVGMMGRFAERLQIGAGALSQITGAEDARSFRNISDAQASQIERLSDKPKGWLDEQRDVDNINPAEIAFLELAKAAWRSADAKGRRSMMRAAKGGFL